MVFSTVGLPSGEEHGNVVSAELQYSHSSECEGAGVGRACPARPYYVCIAASKG